MPIATWAAAVVSLALLALISFRSSSEVFLVKARRASWQQFLPAMVVIATSIWLSRLHDERRYFIELVAGVGTSLSIDADTHEIVWEGSISYYMPNQIFEALDERPKSDWTLVLKNVPGGSIEASSAMVGLASRYGIETARVDGECFSMCSNVWIMFPAREMVEGSVLGWHGLYEVVTGEPMISSIETKLIPLLVGYGFPESLVSHWAHLPINHFYYMTAADLEKLSIPLKRLPASPR